MYYVLCIMYHVSVFIIHRQYIYAIYSNTSISVAFLAQALFLPNISAHPSNAIHFERSG